MRYLNTSIALSVADRYHELGLPVGVLVVDYFNMVRRGVRPLAGQRMEPDGL